MWRKVAEPSVNFKNAKGGSRGSISGPDGKYSKWAVIVDADYISREFIVWFQNLTKPDGTVVGDVSFRLPWLNADPWAFAAWNHEGTLKIVFKQYPNQQFGVYNTGYFTED